MTSVLQVATASHWLYLALAGIVLVIGLGLILRKWGKPDRFISKGSWSSFVTDFGPIFYCFLLLLLCCLLVWKAFTIRIGHVGGVGDSILPGLFASMVEDIIFFSAIGAILFVTQRREFERGRNLDDRIDTLFNAKKLTSEELSDLKRQVRRVGCDFRRNESTLDIREYDAGHDCLRLDVTRRWFVSSYFSDDAVEYEWKLKIRPDEIAGVSPLLTIFPSRMRTHLLDAAGRQRSSSDPVELHGPVVLTTPQTYTHPPRIEKIEPRTLREFHSRYSAWQRVSKLDGSGRDYWEFEAEKHWDIFVLKVVNSLQKRLRVIIRAKEVRTFDLSPGAEQVEPMEVSDLVHGGQVFVEFELLH